ncbi:hypothetical protein Hypma_007094 [Hypsizygus marmoreus]|uniref:Uncharacterized protein n=1 Tax=Hypsizygus marmoreus TaxID=39966 RepID=A0A369KA07_HYPMA|nr:hypothetical protein Hypma_007094 [Hypsizygus marmoreus]
MQRYTIVLALAGLCAASTLAYPHQNPRDVSASIRKRDLESLVNVLIARRDSLDEQMSHIQRRGMELEALVEELVARRLTASELARTTQQRPQRTVTVWNVEGGDHDQRTRPRRGNCSGQPLSTTGNGAQCAAYPRAHITGFLYVPQGQIEPRCDSREQMAQAPAATIIGSCFGTIVDGSVVTLAQSGH